MTVAIVRLIGVSILLLGFSISSATIASAHAILESSSPADQSVLEGSPARVVLTFSEPVTFVAGSLRVFDAAGKRVDRGVVSHAGASNQAAVDLAPDLATGSYAVAWRVISADTHPVHGGFVFSVREPGKVDSFASVLRTSSQRGYQAAGAALRAIGYVAAFIVVGAAVYVAFVGRRSSGTTGVRRAMVAATVIALASQVLGLPVAAALATGQGPGSMFSPGVPAEILGQGTAITIAAVALATVLGLAVFVVEGSARRILAVLAVGFVAAGSVASGHARTTSPTWLVSLVEAVHVAAAAIWVGGLAMLAWSLRSHRRSEPPSDAAVAAGEVAVFSRLAGFTILAVGVAGGVLAFIEVGSIRGLTSTAYGRMVIAKIVLLVVLAALGAFNRYRLVPAVSARPDRGLRWTYLRRTLAAEAFAMVAVLGVTGVLVDSVPARTAVASRAVYSATAKIGSGSVNLVIDPARTGPTALHVYLLDAHGRADDHVQSMSVSFTQTKFGLGPIFEDLRRAGPGHYVTNGTLFTVAGTWKVTVYVRVDEFTENSVVLQASIHS